MRGRLLRLFVGLAPFILLAGALILFVRTKEPRVFTYAGLLAGLYIVVILLAARRGRRRASTRGGGRRRRLNQK